MTEGSLKLNETARISLSYTEMTSTLPWHQSVTAFCQWTILRGSYDALRSSVCSIDRWMLGKLRRNSARGWSRCQGPRGCKHRRSYWLAEYCTDWHSDPIACFADERPLGSPGCTDWGDCPHHLCRWLRFNRREAQTVSDSSAKHT